jgi:type IV secretory pathway VirB9-like protein
MGRIHLAYRLEDDPKGGTPPWLPRTVFDDGRHTFVQLPPLQGQRLPAVFAKAQTGATVLTQSRLYTQAAKPEAGAWLIVQGLHPALELKDATGLRVTLVRQPTTTLAQGGPRVP